MTTPTHHRAAVTVMGVGLALTVLATVVPFLGRPVGRLIAEHVEAGYPGYGPERIQTAVMIYLTVLAAVGALGIAGWITAIVATRAGKRWATWLATAMLVVGTSIGTFDLLVRDTSGDTGLPPAVGWLGLLPSAAGLLAVVLLWMARPPQTDAARVRAA